MSDTDTASSGLPAGAATGRPNPNADASQSKAAGYHMGTVDAVISVEDVVRQAQAIAEDVSVDQLDALVGGEPYVSITYLRAGYGQMEILHDLNLRLGASSRSA